MDKARRRFWASRLAEWSDVPDFIQLVKECHREAGFGTLINHGMGFWRDAWLAAKHAKLSGASSVRLLQSVPYPDYQLRLDGSEHSFEATEAIKSRRRRGDEFREDLEASDRGQFLIRADPEDQWLNPTLALELLNRCAIKKAAKPYASSCGLLIYLNESNYGSDAPGIEATFKEGTRVAGELFQSVHVLWSGRLYEVWKHGSSNV